MRFLFVTDTHGRGNNPHSRKDHFPETVITKLKEVIQIANHYEVKAILHGGDFFHTPNPSFHIGGEIAAVLKSATVPVYGIAGNHDIFGHNPMTLPRTMLGFISRMGVVQLIRPNERVYFNENGMTVQLTGQEYHYDIDRRDPNLDYVVKKENADFAIHLVHGMMLDKPRMEGMIHTTVDMIKHTEADFTLCGHNHNGIPDMEVDGKWFLNPGSMVRIYNNMSEMKRPIQVLLIDFNNGKPTFQKIRLKSAKPSDEVLDRSMIEKAALREQKLAGFVQSIKSAGEFQSMNISTIIEEIANREGLNDKIKQETLRRIAEAEISFVGGGE